MNVQEGARRMRYAGVWLAVVPACWSALFLCIRMGSMFRPGTDGIAGGLAIAGGFGIREIVIAAAPGLLLWIAGWIVEGFAKDPNSGQV